jgi:hypothetical protein
MKLALTSLFLAAPAMAFAPSAHFGASSALKMATETTEKVRIEHMILGIFYRNAERRKNEMKGIVDCYS